LLCLEREDLEASVYEDFALDRLEWCEATLPSPLLRGSWSATKEEMSVLGAALCATLWALDGAALGALDGAGLCAALGDFEGAALGALEGAALW
jgi:hypothetical protein